MTALDGDFFATAAQVMPILLLAGLIDYGGAPAPEPPGAPRHRLGGPEVSLAILRSIMMLGLLWGEIAALVAVAGRPTILERHFVVFGLAAGALAVVDRFAEREIDRLLGTTRWHARLRLIVVFAFLSFGALLATIFFALF